METNQSNGVDPNLGSTQININPAAIYWYKHLHS